MSAPPSAKHAASGGAIAVLVERIAQLPPSRVESVPAGGRPSQRAP
jgi:hypothetical protein